MKKNYSGLVLALFALLLSTTLSAQSESELKNQRIRSSYVIALGRLPDKGELNYWMSREKLTVEQLVTIHNQYLQSNKTAKRQMIIKSFKDSYGYAPTEGNINTNMPSGYNYTQWVNNHTQYLRSNSNSYNQMLSKVYQNICGRMPTDNDKRSWPLRDAKPYYVVSAIVENWFRLNGNTPKNTVDANSKFFSSLKVSDLVAKEAVNAVAAGGGNVIAAGGGNVVAAGGGNVVAAGGGNVVAAGGLN